MHAHHVPDEAMDREEPLTPAQIAETQATNDDRAFRSLAVASNLIAERLTGRFAIFDDCGEGTILPDDTEELSGHVVDERGEHYFFWVDWDPAAGRPRLGTWERIAASELSANGSAEYRHALAAVGLADTPAGGRQAATGRD